MKRGRKPNTSYDEAVREAVAAGAVSADIAARLSIPYKQVRAAISRLGLEVADGRKNHARHARVRDFDAAVQKAAESGLTRVEIAEKLGVKRASVDASIRRTGVETVHAHTSAVDTERDAEFVRLYASGRTLEQIGQSYGITRERVRQILKARTSITARDGGAALGARKRREERATTRDKSYMSRLGCGWDEYKRIRDIGRELIAAGAPPCKAPLRAFLNQKGAASHRKIDWHLSFWEWWTVWQQSGRWLHRGRGQGYVMCRKSDVGPYAVGNVFIATAAENSSTRKNRKSDLPMGVSFKKGAYVALRSINGKQTYLGRYPTAALAYAAYVAATPPHQPTSYGSSQLFSLER